MSIISSVSNDGIECFAAAASERLVLNSAVCFLFATRCSVVSGEHVGVVVSSM